MVRLFGFAWGGRAANRSNDRAVDEVDRVSGSRSSAQRNSLSEKNTAGSSSSVNGKKGKRRRRFEEDRKKEEQKGARRKSFEHRGSLTSSVPQGRICRQAPVQSSFAGNLPHSRTHCLKLSSTIKTD